MLPVPLGLCPRCQLPRCRSRWACPAVLAPALPIPAGPVPAALAPEVPVAVLVRGLLPKLLPLVAPPCGATTAAAPAPPSRIPAAAAARAAAAPDIAAEPVPTPPAPSAAGLRTTCGPRRFPQRLRHRSRQQTGVAACDESRGSSRSTSTARARPAHRAATSSARAAAAHRPAARRAGSERSPSHLLCLTQRAKRNHPQQRHLEPGAGSGARPRSRRPVMAV